MSYLMPEEWHYGLMERLFNSLQLRMAQMKAITEINYWNEIEMQQIYQIVDWTRRSRHLQVRRFYRGGFI